MQEKYFLAASMSSPGVFRIFTDKDARDQWVLERPGRRAVATPDVSGISKGHDAMVAKGYPRVALRTVWALSLKKFGTP